MARNIRSRAFALLLGLALVGSHAPLAADERPSVLVTITHVRSGSLPQIVTGYGTAQADPSARQSVMAPVSATVSNIFVRMGEEVAKGRPLIELQPAPQTHASYALAASALSAANVQLQRTRELFKQFLATRQQLADAQKAQSDAQVALQALKVEGAGGANVVRTSFDAVVTKLDTSVGSLVNEGAPLLELAPPNSLVLRIGVVPSEATGVKVGDKATVTPVGGRQKFDATVVLRGSVVDPGNGLVPVELSLPPGSLFPGQTAQAAIATASVHGFVVPHEAILINDSGHPYVVQVIGEAAKLIPVEILNGDGGRDVIAGKLDPKAPVVLSGAHQLQDGMKVRLSNPSQTGQ